MIKEKVWYSIGASVDYVKGIFRMIIHEKEIKKWSYMKPVSKNRGYGLRLDKAYIILGGDRHYNKFYGSLKNARFYY